MEKFFAQLKGNHGHSHGPGGSCQGHSHGAGNQPSHMEMSEEERQAMLKVLEERMAMMRGASSHVMRPGKVLYDPNDPGPGLYNPLVYGYGHEGAPLPMGWGALGPPPPNIPAAPTGGSDIMSSSVNFEDMMSMHMGPVYRDNFWSLMLPFVGRIRVIKDRKGLLMALGVVLYWLYGNWSTWTAILLPYYADGVISLPLVLLYASVSVLCITSFVRASSLNPGSLITGEMPKADWTECKVCMVLRPPLSHHCRRCGQCVRRMDHHCPWINNCVGEENQFAFMLLLLYSFLLSLVTLIIEFIYFFQLDNCVNCERDSFVIRHQSGITYVCLVEAILMLLFSLGLLLQLHMAVMLDTPTVERMKIEQQMYLTGVVPDKLFKRDKSMLALYSKLCGRPPLWAILFPCRRRQQRGVQ